MVSVNKHPGLRDLKSLVGPSWAPTKKGWSRPQVNIKVLLLTLDTYRQQVA